MKVSLTRFALAVASVAATVNAQVVQPQSDAFYQPPAGFESTAPGTVLRSRTITAALFGSIPQANLKTYQLLYRTIAINGSALAGVTTVFVPPRALTDRFVSFQTAYDSSSNACEPSYTYQLKSEQNNIISAAEQLLIQAYLGKKYIVSAPDYEGPEAAWTPGRLSGTGVLDSIRAVQNFGATLGLTTKTPLVVGQGYSGGGLATSWAAALKQSYAPELRVVGWSAGGTPANLTGTAVYLDNSATSGFLVAAVAGLSKDSAYGAQLKVFINTIATTFGRAAFEYGNTHCGLDCVAKYPYESIQSTKYQSLGNRLYYEPTIRAVLDQNVLGLYRNETPTVPMYIYNARPDQIIPYGDAATMVDRWCDQGANIKFVTLEAGGHISTEIVGFPNAFQFAQDAFAGKLKSSGCQRKSEFGGGILNPLALGLDLEPILFKLLDLLAKLKPQDEKTRQNVIMVGDEAATM